LNQAPIEADYTYVGGALTAGVSVSLDGDRIADVGPASGNTNRLPGTALLPGFVNAHSHAFQRLLRGRTERAGDTDDDFWSWRTAMYSLVEQLTPEEIEQVCRLAFLEMVAAGYTHVAEFHYLHHGPDGTPYEDPLELTRRVLAAADWAGIGITLLRTAYARSGPGAAPLPAQRRFVDADPDSFASQLEASLALRDDGPRPVRVGVAAHSVRALGRDYLAALGSLTERHRLPLHAHVAEQPLEIQQCLGEHGVRPIELLDELGLLSDRFVGVHATFLGPGEPERLGRAGANACICPTTERNLGDGLPDLQALRQAGVVLSLGTDSHARIDPFAELRALEDGERLRRGARNALAARGGSVAPVLFDAATAGSAAAVGLDAGAIEAGRRADLVAVRLDDRALAALDCGGEAADAVLAGLFLGGHARMVTSVWVGGVRQDVAEDERWGEAAGACRAIVNRVWGAPAPRGTA